MDGLDEILILLDSLSSTTKVSFLTSMYFFEDEQDINVIDALKKYGRMSEQMQEIIHQAKLFGKHISN
ncbi:hypothetical protein MC862_000289 [Proteus mirabilis]